MSVKRIDGQSGNPQKCVICGKAGGCLKHRCPQAHKRLILGLEMVRDEVLGVPLIPFSPQGHMTRVFFAIRNLA